MSDHVVRDMDGFEHPVAPVDPVEAILAVECPLPSCGAKVGDTCGRKYGQQVGTVQVPYVHHARIRTALASPTSPTERAEPDETCKGCGHVHLFLDCGAIVAKGIYCHCLRRPTPPKGTAP